MVAYVVVGEQEKLLSAILAMWDAEAEVIVA
jgi:hypothetical protein